MDFFKAKFDSEQKSIPVNFPKNQQLRSYKQYKKLGLMREIIPPQN